jgi:hypothetical protein
MDNKIFKLFLSISFFILLFSVYKLYTPGLICYNLYQKCNNLYNLKDIKVDSFIIFIIIKLFQSYLIYSLHKSLISLPRTKSFYLFNFMNIITIFKSSNYVISMFFNSVLLLFNMQIFKTISYLPEFLSIILLLIYSFIYYTEYSNISLKLSNLLIVITYIIRCITLPSFIWIIPLSIHILGYNVLLDPNLESLLNQILKYFQIILSLKFIVNFIFNLYKSYQSKPKDLEDIRNNIRNNFIILQDHEKMIKNQNTYLLSTVNTTNTIGLNLSSLIDQTDKLRLIVLSVIDLIDKIIEFL